MKHLKEYINESILSSTYSGKWGLIEEWIKDHIQFPNSAVLNKETGRIDYENTWRDLKLQNINSQEDFPEYIKFGNIYRFDLTNECAKYMTADQYPANTNFFYIDDCTEKIKPFVANTQQLLIGSYFKNAKNIEGITIKSPTGECILSVVSKNFKLKNFEKIYAGKDVEIKLDLSSDVMSVFSGNELKRKINDFLRNKIKNFDSIEYTEYEEELSDVIASCFPGIENIKQIKLDWETIIYRTNKNGKNLLIINKLTGNPNNNLYQAPMYLTDFALK